MRSLPNVIPKQGPNPSKPPQITPKIAFVDPNFTFCSPKSHKNPEVGKQIWEKSPKKKFFFTPSLSGNTQTTAMGPEHPFLKMSVKDCDEREKSDLIQDDLG